jgi:hypothetical protein
VCEREKVVNDHQQRKGEFSGPVLYDHTGRVILSFLFIQRIHNDPTMTNLRLRLMELIVRDWNHSDDT